HIVREVVEELTKEKYRNDLEVIGVDLSFTYILGHHDSWCLGEFKTLIEEGTIGGLSDRDLLDWLNDRKMPDITCLSVNIRDASRLHEWIDYLRDKFDRYFDIYASGDHYIELMRPGINKGHGVRSMMKIYNLKEHEVAVVGDNQNDISMFFATPNSFAMSTATDQVKKYAKYTVNSVAEAIDIIMKENEAEKVSKSFY
ncbi:MAG: HAD hydrolase family protein, partial [Erysipelotrichaceae bacterium]|nr:HAD hydrolase family protein [Erysipelotrichaceae bacterium]